MLTKVHRCLQVALSPLCETVVNERGYDDDFISL